MKPPFAIGAAGIAAAMLALPGAAVAWPGSRELFLCTHGKKRAKVAAEL